MADGSWEIHRMEKPSGVTGDDNYTVVKTIWARHKSDHNTREFEKAPTH